MWSVNYSTRRMPIMNAGVWSIGVLNILGYDPTELIETFLEEDDFGNYDGSRYDDYDCDEVYDYTPVSQQSPVRQPEAVRARRNPKYYDSAMPEFAYRGRKRQRRGKGMNPRIKDLKYWRNAERTWIPEKFVNELQQLKDNPPWRVQAEFNKVKVNDYSTWGDYCNQFKRLSGLGWEMMWYIRNPQPFDTLIKGKERQRKNRELIVRVQTWIDWYYKVYKDWVADVEKAVEAVTKRAEVTDKQWRNRLLKDRKFNGKKLRRTTHRKICISEEEELDILDTVTGEGD